VGGTLAISVAPDSDPQEHHPEDSPDQQQGQVAGKPCLFKEVHSRQIVLLMVEK
jgi:hypothetical protein